jgi:hypothetical protein
MALKWHPLNNIFGIIIAFSILEQIWGFLSQQFITERRCKR